MASDNNAIISEPPAVTQVTHESAKNGPILGGESSPNYGKDLNVPGIPIESRAAVWFESKDGDPAGIALFRRHYSYNIHRNQMSLWWARERNRNLFVGPGEKLVLLTGDGLALFAWRKFRSQDGQQGVNCSIFRNESMARASDLVTEADRIAFARWPGERHYTYVDPSKVRRTRTPGRCFLKAGWRYVRTADGQRARTKARGLLILELIPREAQHANR